MIVAHEFEAFAVGTPVTHKKFGAGTVDAVNDDKVSVAFQYAGKKKVLDSFLQKTGHPATELRLVVARQRPWQNGNPAENSLRHLAGSGYLPFYVNDAELVHYIGKTIAIFDVEVEEKQGVAPATLAFNVEDADSARRRLHLQRFSEFCNAVGMEMTDSVLNFRGLQGCLRVATPGDWPLFSSLEHSVGLREWALTSDEAV